MSFRETLAASRRLFILRLLVELAGEANESVIASTVRQGGFGQAARAEIAADLDHLCRYALTHDDYVGALRVVRVTERGEDAAHGRLTVEGVEHSIWRRG